MDQIQNGLGVRRCRGDAADLFLYRLRAEKSLSFGERRMLETARALIVKESGGISSAR